MTSLREEAEKYVKDWMIPSLTGTPVHTESLHRLLTRLVEEARLQEREACAKIADHFYDETKEHPRQTNSGRAAAFELAMTIRNRGAHDK